MQCEYYETGYMLFTIHMHFYTRYVYTVHKTNYTNYLNPRKWFGSLGTKQNTQS